MPERAPGLAAAQGCLGLHSPVQFHPFQSAQSQSVGLHSPIGNDSRVNSGQPTVVHGLVSLVDSQAIETPGHSGRMAGVSSLQIPIVRSTGVVAQRVHLGAVGAKPRPFQSQWQPGLSLCLAHVVNSRREGMAVDLRLLRFGNAPWPRRTSAGLSFCPE